MTSGSEISTTRSPAGVVLVPSVSGAASGTRISPFDALNAVPWKTSPAASESVRRTSAWSSAAPDAAGDTVPPDETRRSWPEASATRGPATSGPPASPSASRLSVDAVVVPADDGSVIRWLRLRSELMARTMPSVRWTAAVTAAEIEPASVSRARADPVPVLP